MGGVTGVTQWREVTLGRASTPEMTVCQVGARMLSC